MKRGNTVYGMRTRNAKICHSYNAAGNDCHSFNLIGIMRGAPNICAEAIIDFLCDFIKAGKQSLIELLAPAFKRLFHNGVVCVSHRFGYNIPSVVPAVAAFIKHNAHKLRNSHCGMGVVNMNCDFLGKIIKSAVFREVAADNILNRSRHKEILLAQAQRFTLR